MIPFFRPHQMEVRTSPKVKLSSITMLLPKCKERIANRELEKDVGYLKKVPRQLISNAIF